VFIDHGIVLDDHNGRSWRIRPIPLSKELVNLRGVLGPYTAHD
jgi:hypothetical protein